jgi:putative tricarboxylic transport membrane protein
MFTFGIVGYLLRKFEYEPAPLILAFVPGPMFEVNLRRSLLMSQGNFTIFTAHPIALSMLIICFITIIFFIYQSRKKTLDKYYKQL